MLAVVEKRILRFAKDDEVWRGRRWGSEKRILRFREG